MSRPRSAPPRGRRPEPVDRLHRHPEQRRTVGILESHRDRLLPGMDGGEQALTRLDQQGPQQEKKDLRSTNVVGILPEDAIMRLVGTQLLEQQEEWRLERRRSFSDVTMAKKPELRMALMLTDVATVGQATIASN